MRKKKIRYIEITKTQTVTQLVSQMKYNAFNARKLSNCAEIWLKACTENTRKYFTLAGAIIPAGYGKLIGQMIESKMIDVLVTTSANMAHDAVQELFDRYMKLFLESPVYWKQLDDGARGAGQPNVNGQTLGNMAMPLPPLAEQHRIVAKVDELMALCDDIESRINNTATTRRQLLEASLSEALAIRRVSGSQF